MTTKVLATGRRETMRSQVSTILVLGGVALLVLGALLGAAPMVAAQDGEQDPALEQTCPGLPGCTITVDVGPSTAHVGQGITASGSYQPCTAAQFMVRVDWGDDASEEGPSQEGDSGDDVPYSFAHAYDSPGDYTVAVLLLHQGAEGQDCAALITDTLTVEPAVGSITVEKSEANGAVPAEWSFEIEGPPDSGYLASSGETVSDLPLGTYRITESGPTGWHLASVSGEGCSQEGQAAATSLLSHGESITCTLTNEADLPSILLEKQVSDDNETWHDADTAPGPLIAEFDPVFWRFVVSNTGNLDLHSVVVTDTVLGEICMLDSLAVGEESSCSFTSAAEEGQHENLGFVAADYLTGTLTVQDPCYYLGVGYLVPTATPTPEPPAPRREKDTPAPATPAAAAPTATPILPTPSPTPTSFVEVLGVERLPETGAPPMAARHPAWLVAGMLVIVSGAALHLLRGKR
jgi:hypothetical protein